MNSSNFQKFKKSLNQISSQNSIEIIQNPSDSKSIEYDLNDYEDENVLLNDKPMININTLQSIRISHSTQSSNNSQSFIDILYENKFNNLNDRNEENNENDVNVNNRLKKKSKIKIKNIKYEQNNSKNLKKNNALSINTNTNNNKQNDIYDKFKERFEEKTKSYKDKKILNPEKIKSKIQNYQNNIEKIKNKLKYIYDISRTKYKKINIKLQNKLNENSISIAQDSFEEDENKNKSCKIFLDKFEKPINDYVDDKNMIVSKFDFDLSKSNSTKKKNNSSRVIKDKNMNFENDNIKKPLVGIGQIPQKKQTEKKKAIKKKIYPVKIINLCNNNLIKNIMELKKQIVTEKSNNKYKSIYSSSSSKISRKKIPYHLDLRKTLCNSNFSKYHIINTPTNIRKQPINKKSNYIITRQFSYKPRHSNKSIFKEKNINLTKYYRISSLNKKNNNKSDLYNYMKKIIVDNRNRNNQNQCLNLPIFKTNSNKNIDGNIFKKNKSLSIKRKKNLNKSYNKNKNKIDIPICYYKKINIKNKIPFQKNVMIFKQKNKLYSNNNKIKIKINNLNSAYFRPNYSIDNKKTNTNNIIGNTNFHINNDRIRGVDENKDNNKIIINTVYNSFTNNIYPIPHKINYSKYKKSHGNNNIINYNYVENPFLLINHRNNAYDKKLVHNNSCLKSPDNFNILTEYNRMSDYSLRNINNGRIPNKIINDKVTKKNYIRNRLLIFNPFKVKENKHKFTSENHSKKNGLENESFIIKNRNLYLNRSSYNLSNNHKKYNLQ